MDDLQDMAGKYADTVEENRKLYNEVQDLKGNIRVFCRIRPPGTTGDQNPSCLDTGVDGEVRPVIMLQQAHIQRHFWLCCNKHTHTLLAVLQQTQTCHITVS